MSRKDWSESRRNEKIEKLMDIIEKAEIKLDHLLSKHWQEPYPKEKK